MEMRRAVARTWTARMTAEGDGFALLVTAIGIAAVAALQIDHGKMARLDLDAAELGNFDPFDCRQWPMKSGRSRFRRANLAETVQTWRHPKRRYLWRPIRLLGSHESHPPGPAEHGVTRIAGLEFLVDCSRGFRTGQPQGKKLPQRVRVLGRPVRWLHY